MAVGARHRGAHLLGYLMTFAHLSACAPNARKDVDSSRNAETELGDRGLLEWIDARRRL